MANGRLLTTFFNALASIETNGELPSVVALHNKNAQIIQTPTTPGTAVTQVIK